MPIFQDTYYRDLFIQANIYIDEGKTNQAKKLLKEISYREKIDNDLKIEVYMRLAFVELHFNGLINPTGEKKALEYVRRAINHGATEQYASPTILMCHLFAGEFQQAANVLRDLDEHPSLFVIETSLMTIFEEITTQLNNKEIYSFYITPQILPFLKAVSEQFPTNDDLNFRIVEWTAELGREGELFSYKVGKEMIERNPDHYQAYIALTKVCCYGYLNLPYELIEYANKGIALIEQLQKETEDYNGMSTQN